MTKASEGHRSAAQKSRRRRSQSREGSSTDACNQAIEVPVDEPANFVRDYRKYHANWAVALGEPVGIGDESEPESTGFAVPGGPSFEPFHAARDVAH